MDYVVDIQGFRDARRQFLPKEVAVVALQKDIVSHCIVQAPCYFSRLPSDIKTINSYLSYLENVIGRSIINLENYNSPSFNKLGSLFPNSAVCMTHLQKHVENKNNFYTLIKARLIKSWLYTIAPEEWRDSNEEIHSKRFYAVLVNHRRAKRKQNFQFGTPDGIDVTDICTENNDSEDSIVFDENAPLASSTGENIPEKR